ncbi:MFS general substrate transporter [Sistotremastrum niveocremeum HHB9708]|uniref:MFS general substrate transporter n=1 Tax=Sistotremastrum niveocremeum HHB9708 TaxID=1314777 RepID=A0A164T6A9_9AGAM|nr:MFS general substrate transporter [Sistotremastrum niveocremeum HHB9708]
MALTTLPQSEQDKSTLMAHPAPSSTGSEKYGTDVTTDKDVDLVHDEEANTKISSAVQGLREGGLRGWMTVFGAFLIQTVTIGHITAFGVYEEFYKQDRLRNTTPSAISWIGGTQLGLLFGLGLVTGPLMDKGYFRALVYSSTMLYALSEFMLSLSKPEKFYQIFLSQGLGMGLAMGMTYSPSLVINGYYFRTRKRALTMGLASCGAAVGGVIQPIMLNNLLASGKSFGVTVRINAGMNTALLLIACLIMKDPRSGTSMSTKKAHVSARALSKDINYALLVLGAFLLSATSFYCELAVYIQLFCITKGFPKTFSFYSLSILNGSSLLGRTIPPIISDKYTGPVPMLIATAFGIAITLFGYLGVRDHHIGDLTGVTILSGFFYGGFSSMVGPAYASTAKNGGEIGIRIGMALAVGAAIPALVSSPINGALLTSRYHWDRALLFSGPLRFPSDASRAVSAKVTLSVGVYFNLNMYSTPSRREITREVYNSATRHSAENRSLLALLGITTRREA